VQINTLCFGSIKGQSILKIWDSDGYAGFRHKFMKRLSVTADLYGQISCDFEVLKKAQGLDRAYTARLKFVRYLEFQSCLFRYD